ncbi:MAG: hypothetical protein E5Y87_07660, partial [Mesorhizobium sp.]
MIAEILDQLVAFHHITNLVARCGPETGQGQLAGGPAIVDDPHAKIDDDESGALVIPASAANNLLDQP